MPKRVGNLYQRFSDRDFVKTVILMACKGKTKRREVRRILADPDGYAEKLCTMLETGTYKPRKPSVSLKYDDSSQKWRTIRTLPFFPDSSVLFLLFPWTGLYSRKQAASCCRFIQSPHS